MIESLATKAAAFLVAVALLASGSAFLAAYQDLLAAEALRGIAGQIAGDLDDLARRPPGSRTQLLGESGAAPRLFHGRSYGVTFETHRVMLRAGAVDATASWSEPLQAAASDPGLPRTVSSGLEVWAVRTQDLLDVETVLLVP